MQGPEVEPAWVMPEGHHPSRVAKSGPRQTLGDHPDNIIIRTKNPYLGKSPYPGQNLRKVPIKEAVHILEGHYQHLRSLLAN